VAEAGAFEAVLVLWPDRLARTDTYQVLILQELERFDVRVIFLERLRAMIPTRASSSRSKGRYGAASSFGPGTALKVAGSLGEHPILDLDRRGSGLLAVAHGVTCSTSPNPLSASTMTGLAGFSSRQVRLMSRDESLAFEGSVVHGQERCAVKAQRRPTLPSSALEAATSFRESGLAPSVRAIKRA
jgi:hypothetical protein